MAWIRRFSPLVRAALLCTVLATPGAASAADVLPYTVDIASTNDSAIDTALKDTAGLVRLRETAPVGGFALISRAREDQGRLATALGGFGYYDAHVTITIDGHPIDDPNLPGLLDASPGPAKVAIAIQQGPLFTLRHIALNGPLTPADRAIADQALALKPGEPARAGDVLAAQGRILSALRDAGHALARVPPPIATLAPAEHGLDVAFAIEPGPTVDLGPIHVDGLDHVNESFVRRRLLIQQGQRFNPGAIEAARQDLANTGVFSTVRIRAPDAVDADGQLPLDIDVVERKRHAVNLSAAFSTDLGGTAGASWQHRNLFGNAEQLTLSANATGLGGSAVTRPGYNIGAVFTKPDLFVRDQALTVNLQAVKEYLEAYDRKAVLGGATLSRKLSPEWTVSAGLQAQQSEITQEGVTRNYTLIGLPLSAKYDTTGPDGLLNPISGVRVQVTATPTASLRGNQNFAILQAVGSTYINFAAPGRSVLALRATIATISGATTFQVPPDQRLYAGGSATVRGYKYQSVGPRFPDNKPTGGTGLAAATVEYRQRIGESFGAAVFVDAGQVGDSSSPFGGNVRVGAGVGARYYTPIGPIRLDVALPLNKQHGDDAFEMYIGIGQAF